MLQTTRMDDAGWMRRFRNRVTARRVPVAGTLELTSRCNLRCVHCYLGPQEEQWKKRSQELSTQRVLSIIDEITAAGCLYLTITGGDPMLHPDFPEIYRYAREQGLIVTVFCDGILVRDHIVELFREYPPAVVEVSLYGATRKTYEAVTRIMGSHARCLTGVRRLIDSGVRVKLKTVLMTVNSHEVEPMRRMAEELGVPFRIDNAIFPCLPDNDQGPLRLRVSPEEAVQRELSDPKRLEQWLGHLDTHAGVPRSESLYRCGAGVTSFFIDPYGYASPCLMTTQYRHSLAEAGFARLWSRELAQLRSKTARDGYECNSCEMQVACGGCPAFHYQETGAEDVKSDYVCETTRVRWETIQRARRSKQPLGPALPAPSSAGSGDWRPVTFAGAADRPDPRGLKA